MSDEGEESDGGDRGHPSEPPSPPLPASLPGEARSPARPLDLFSSASPLLGDTDPPYLASPECLHPSPENLSPGERAHTTATRLCRGTEDVRSPFRLRRNVRLDAAYGHYDEPLAMWRGRGTERPRQAPELLDRENHYSAEHIDTEFTSDNRQT